MSVRRQAAEKSIWGERLKRLSDFLARYPGLVPLIGLGLILLNFVLQLLPDWPVIAWMAQVNLLLHLGLVVSLLGILFIRAL
jgi:hypothetical protein